MVELQQMKWEENQDKIENHNVSSQYTKSIYDSYITETIPQSVDELAFIQDIKLREVSQHIICELLNNMKCLLPNIDYNNKPSPLSITINEGKVTIEWTIDYKTSEFIINKDGVRWLFTKSSDDEILTIVGALYEETLTKIVQRVILLMHGV